MGRGQIPPSSTFCSTQALNGLDDPRPRWGGGFTLLSPLVQMLTSFGNILTDMPRNNVNLGTCGWSGQQKLNHQRLNNIPVYGYTFYLFIHQLMDSVCCVHFLIIINHAALSIEFEFLCEHISISTVIRWLVLYKSIIASWYRVLSSLFP